MKNGIEGEVWKVQAPWNGEKVVEMVWLYEKIRQCIHCFVRGDIKPNSSLVG